MIKKYKIFTTVGCDKCEFAKQYLKEQGIYGEEVSIAEDKGIAELRKLYPRIKDKITRTENGSLPIPLVLFFDENDEIIGVKHKQEEIEEFVRENK